MSKFMIECPKCHKYNEAANGLFARRSIPCPCGNIINVRNDKIVTRVCPNCGNTVVYDQSEGTKARCPVCGKQLVADGDMKKLIHFPCRTCGCLLQADKTADRITCALCGAENDIKAEVRKAQLREKGEPATIEYRGDRKTLVWRHPMTEFVFGSQLIVREGQEAIFLRNGEALDSFGPGRHTLELPAMPRLQEKLGGTGDIPFRAEVYFVNMLTVFNQKWGTPNKVSFRDPDTNIPFDIGASGGFSMRITNPRKVLGRIVGTQDDLKSEDLFDMNNGYFRQTILGRIKGRMAQCIQSEMISVFELDSHLDVISRSIQDAVNEDLTDYGIELPDFTVVNIVVPEDDPNYRELKSIHAKKVLDMEKARLEVNVHRVRNESIVADAETEAEALRIKKKAEADAYGYQATAEAREMREKGYTYQQETQRKTAMAAMENGGGAAAAGGIAADMLQLGVGLSAAKQVSELTKAALQPEADSAEGWDCACGQKGNRLAFCPNCGAKKPVSAATWDCACGQRGNTLMYCPNCGARRPGADTWDCSCGQTGNKLPFCPSCGRKRP